MNDDISVPLLALQKINTDKKNIKKVHINELNY